MVSKVLVPVDGSAAALRALEYAGVRKRTAGGTVSIVVLNVQAPLPPSRYVTRSMIRDQNSRLAFAALRSARSASRKSKLDARFYVRHGDPASMITRFARSMNCSEIAMGTRGRGRTGIFVLGSVALRVVQLSRVAVTLVK